MVTSITALEQKRAKLLADADKLEKQIADAKQRGTKEQCAIIDMLPRRLGVKDLEAVAIMIRARIRGAFGPLSAPTTPSVRKPPTRLTPEQHANLDHMIMERSEDGIQWKHTVDEIAAAIPCSIATVGNRRRAMIAKQRAGTPA